ncbi:TPA: hypothetical protein ACKP89_000496 [Stenotrophomonas maltophilia]|nr:hypothetical protein [Stenotrophomonas maltophilia]AVH90185.1 hypothetical protein AL480_04820 [Stenotrophomonas maltophilia]EJP77062.1 hypothetical protein A1OC_01871 [Stenotrophomonas maltophilia Ab55555]ELE7120922.1 hypothetical protein [Stenotrophomonas maltophilia]MBA0233593.1 hypothetical protein [Stenotrophomonas maltophilia]MBA0267126.1 hypothetical protein [Stenotrophomonas maltophilia]
METEGFRRTLRGVIDGHRFLVTVTSQAGEVFQFTATVDGVAVEVRDRGVIRNKGDAMQLAMVAVERYIAELGGKC